MTGDDLPAGDSVVRYVKPTLIQDDGMPDGSDFRLRPDRPDETGLSVHWLEAFGGGRGEQLREVRRVSRLRLAVNGRFAEMQVGMILDKVARELATVRIVHDPLDDADGIDPSHSQITGLPAGDSDQALLVGDLIAECVTRMHQAMSGDDN